MLKVSVWDLIYRTFDKLGTKPPSVSELLEMCKPDDEAWKLYEKGCTLSVNQVEQKGTSSRVMQYKPKNISELCAFVAAIRPGFRSLCRTFLERKSFSYGVKDFDELIQTEEMPNSFILYQEMEMAVLNYAGIPMSECYTAIKNIAKKRADKVLSYKEKFINSMTKTMIDKDKMSKEKASELAESLWKVIEDSSNYSFNACVSGDTKLSWMANTSKYHPTVEEMFFVMNSKEYAEKTNHIQLRNKYRRCGYGTYLSMFEDGRIKKNKMVDISFAGVKPVYRVETETGEYIDCTINHKFPTPTGMKELGSLHIGDELYVKGNYEKCKNKYTFTNGDFKSNVPKKGQVGFQKIPDGSTVIYSEARKKYIEQKSACSCCGKPYSNDERFELHHSDFDRTNNVMSNYEWLCVSCHKKKHFNHGRTTVFQKGLLTRTSKIKAITYLREDRVYDVCMSDPAHTIVSESGLVASNSHSYCVALDSLYCAWLKMHHPLEFYSTAIEIQAKKGNKDKINELKEEAESYFNIQFPIFKYGQDNRTITFDAEKNAIYNSIDSIKGFGKSVAEALYESSKDINNVSFDSTFFDVLKKLDCHGIKSSKVIPLIKIGYFDEYGKIPELMDATKLWDALKQGSAKQLSSSIIDDKYIQILIEEGSFVSNKNAKGKELKTYTIIDMTKLLIRLWYLIKGMNYDDPSYSEIASNQMEVLGYVDLTTGKEEDRRKLYVMEQYSLPDRFKGGIWKYCVKTKSLGSGKISLLNILPQLYSSDPVREGDIVLAEKVAKDSRGYWNMLSYKHIY